MQREDNTMADTLAIIVNLEHFLRQHFKDSQVFAIDQVTKNIRIRWAVAEQPLFVMCFLLHPKYRAVARNIIKKNTEKHGTWQDDKNPLCPHLLTPAAVFYYQKHKLWMTTDENERNKELHSLRVKFFLWLTSDAMDNDPNYVDYKPKTEEDGGNETWLSNNEGILGKALTNFARFLLDAPTQGATCERLFKEFTCYLTKARNRLADDKLEMLMKECYPEDFPGDGIKSGKNRFISPNEHKHLANVDEDDNSLELSQSPTNSEKEEESVVYMHLPD